MSFLVDPAIGFLMMNAMAHLILGQTRTRFLTPFGYSAAANIAYAILCMLSALTIFHLQYGVTAIFANWIILAGLCLWMLFLIIGRLLISLFRGV